MKTWNVCTRIMLTEMKENVDEDFSKRKNLSGAGEIRGWAPMARWKNTFRMTYNIGLTK